MKIGTIDIGTNSMRLLTAQYKDGKIIDRKKYVNTTRIGQGVDSNGYISKEAIDRNIQALKEFKAICDEYKCDYICCMGTSALRDSKNSNEFVELAKKEANVDVEIITGDRESNLGFLGVLEGLPELVCAVSALTGGTAIGAVCLDSDFVGVVLARNGEQMDMGYIGVPYGAEEEEGLELHTEQWLPLLTRPEDAAALEDCLHGGFVLAEDQLRTLSRLIGLPVLDDDILTQYLEEFEDF